jgi:hypothetical protein
MTEAEKSVYVRWYCHVTRMYCWAYDGKTATHPLLYLISKAVIFKSEYYSYLQVISVLNRTSCMPCLILVSNIKLKRLITIRFDYILYIFAEDGECVPAEPKRPTWIWICCACSTRIWAAFANVGSITSLPAPDIWILTCLGTCSMQEYGVTAWSTWLYSTNTMKQEKSASSALICCGMEYSIVIIWDLRPH